MDDHRAERGEFVRQLLERAGIQPAHGPEDGPYLWERTAPAIYAPLPDGTVRRRYLYNRDRDRLREQLNELTYQVGKGVPVPDGSMTVGEYLDQWLAEVAAKQVRPSTYTGYETNVRLHIKPLIGPKKLAKLTARDVRQMIEKLRSKPLSRVPGSCPIERCNTCTRLSVRRWNKHAGRN